MAPLRAPAYRCRPRTAGHALALCYARIAMADTKISTPSGAYPRLLSLAVHEFRTPASVVGGYLRMLQREGGDPLTAQQRKMIEEAEKSCARLVAMFGQLSEIGKLDSGAVRLARQPVDIFSL